MKFLSSVLLAIAAVTSVTAQCPSCPEITPLFRSFAGALTDHFYTANPSEVISAATPGSGSYIPQGVAAGIFSTQIASSTPLFELWNGAVDDHAYTASALGVDALEAEGYVLVAVTPGYVYTTQICNSVPLYGLFSVLAQDHFMTTSASERATAIAEGYTDQGIVAYVPVRGIIGGDTTC